MLEGIVYRSPLETCAIWYICNVRYTISTGRPSSVSTLARGLVRRLNYTPHWAVNRENRFLRRSSVSLIALESLISRFSSAVAMGATPLDELLTMVLELTMQVS